MFAQQKNTHNIIFHFNMQQDHFNLWIFVKNVIKHLYYCDQKRRDPEKLMTHTPPSLEPRRLRSTDLSYTC
jgi:hypothetical protein